MNFFVSRGVRFAYRVDGPEDAPTLVMSNSLGTDLSMWDAQVALLSSTLRIVRYDCRGHGASAVPAGPYSMEMLGLDLLALLDMLHIEQAHICGLSLGGAIALWFSAHYPSRVTSAIFANTAAKIGSEEIWNARIEAVSAGGMLSICDAVLARFLSEKFRWQHPEMTQKIGAMIEATDPAGYIGACAALRDVDLREIVGTIHVPSLILGGELDMSTPPAQARELHAAIGGSQLVIFPDVAHLSNIEQPEEFSKNMLDFVTHA
jgi:3-oxoadipate enol-lactonase